MRRCKVGQSPHAIPTSLAHFDFLVRGNDTNFRFQSVFKIYRFEKDFYSQCNILSCTVGSKSFATNELTILNSKFYLFFESDQKILNKMLIARIPILVYSSSL